MVSTTSDAGQHTLLQIFTPPASRAVAISLSDKEAVLSADGKSKRDVIWISSDDGSHTEDEGDDEGQNLDDSQTPTTSTADHLGKVLSTIILSGVSPNSLFIDSTSTKHSLSESEAAIGVHTTPAVSPALGEDDQD
jgi:hypothetical protein